MPGVKGRSGRSGKPIAQHKLEGTFDPRVHGAYNHPMDNITSLPAMPDDLPAGSECMYAHILHEYQNIPGVLASIDEYQLSMLCRWYSQAKSLAIRMQNEDEDAECAKLERRAKNAWETFDKIARQFGLTPSARTALRTGSVPNAGGSNPLEEFGISE